MHIIKPQNKYWSSISIALHQQLANRGLFVGRIFLYVSVVYLFSQVFKSVSATPERIWYLAITEWIILSTPSIAFHISEDIKSGQIAYFILRPIHYLVYRLCEGFGVIAVRFLVLGVCCLTIGYLLTGMIPGNLITWCIGAIFGILSIFLYSLLQILIGIFSFWIKEIQTIVYLNLTATFCFGGLIVPLEFYSTTVRTFAFSSPYPWVLWWPAQFLTGGSVNIAFALLGWAIWVVILLFLIRFVYAKCLQNFVSEGG